MHIRKHARIVLVALSAAACASPPPAPARPGPERPRVVVSVPRDSGIVIAVTDDSRLESDGEIRVRCTLPARPQWKWYAGVTATFAFNIVAEHDAFIRDEEVWTTPEQQFAPEPGAPRVMDLVFRCPDFAARRAEGRRLLGCRVRVIVDVPSPTVADVRRSDGTVLPGTPLLGGRYECMEITFGVLGRQGGEPVHVRLRNVSGFDVAATEVCARDADTGRATPWLPVRPTRPGEDVLIDLPSGDLRERVVVEMRWAGGATDGPR